MPTQDYIVKGNYYLMADKILANYSVTYNDNPTFEDIYDMFGNLFQVKILYGDENQRPDGKNRGEDGRRHSGKVKSWLRATESAGHRKALDLIQSIVKLTGNGKTTRAV